MLILNDQGQLVYYQSVADALDAWDFKEQPNGLLSYYDQKNSTFYVMNSHYQVVNTYQAGDGYSADLHELQILPNGNALLMIIRCGDGGYERYRFGRETERDRYRFGDSGTRSIQECDLRMAKLGSFFVF